jgi:imidazolonepropionase-like amidohydrolase
MRKVIKAKGLIDVRRGEVVQDPMLVIEGERIVGLGVQGDSSLVQGQEEVLDLSEQYILPGLINSHAHLVMPADGNSLQSWAQQSDEIFLLTAAKNARIALMSGVTTIRDCGDRGGVMFALRKAIDMGLIEGPHLFLSGTMLTITGGHCHFFLVRWTDRKE